MLFDIFISFKQFHKPKRSCASNLANIMPSFLLFLFFIVQAQSCHEGCFIFFHSLPLRRSQRRSSHQILSCFPGSWVRVLEEPEAEKICMHINKTTTKMQKKSLRSITYRVAKSFGFLLFPSPLFTFRDLCKRNTK